jgi:hypothetical protein
MSKVWSLFALLAVAFVAHGATNAQGGTIERCLERIGTPYKGTIPANMKLLPPCKNAEKMGDGEHHWVFTGRTRISGTIVYTSGEYGGYRITPDATSTTLLPSAVQGLELEDHKGDRSPVPSGISENELVCMNTMGTVEFSKLSVVNDGTDSSGERVSHYKVISLGRWKKCQGQSQ